MKKILYLITQSEFGGAQRYVFDLAKNLKDDFDVSFAYGEPGDTGELAIELKKLEIKHYNIIHLKRSISLINDFLALIEIIKLIKKIQPDIIHLNSSKISILGSLAKLCVTSYELRVIYTVHGWVFNEPLPLLLKLLYKYAEKFTSVLKDKIICVSQYDYQIAIRKKIAAGKKLITIHNGIEPINFLSLEQARQALFEKIRNKKLEIRNFIIGSIGNLYKTKGFNYFIEAAKIISSNLKIPIFFIIIGEGNERKSLEDLIKQNNLHNIFILAGRINDAAKLLPAFDIYICSSVKEGLSYTLMEAMQAGLPIVATCVGGNKELIENEKTGILVPTMKPELLAQEVIKLINNPEKRWELGRQARQKLQTKFTSKTMIKNTKDIYEKII